MGVYIKGITAEMLKKASLESIEALIAEGDFVEVKEPHGRLIDETRISDATVWRGGYDHRICGHIFETDAPTVIEAEGK